MKEGHLTGGNLVAPHFASGLGSGIASAIILQPLDLLKTRVQQSASSSLSASLREIRLSPHVVRSLWRGTVPSALRTGLGSAIYFSTLNAIRQHLGRRHVLGTHAPQRNASSVLPATTSWVNLVSGAMARTFAGFVLMPLTVIKVRFESTLYSYSSMAAAIADIRRREGLRAFFSGFGATTMRDAPYAGMYVVIYESLKTQIGLSAMALGPSTGGDALKLTASAATSVNFVAAALAGAGCSAISNPFDAIKTRVQLQPQHYRSIGQAGYKMIATEGFHSLWDGLALRMSRKALSSALAWTIYEELIRRFSAH